MSAPPQYYSSLIQRSHPHYRHHRWPPQNTVKRKRYFALIERLTTMSGSGSPIPSGILKKGYSQTDRQYSYEHTVLGRYRLEAADEAEEVQRRERVGFEPGLGLEDEEQQKQEEKGEWRRAKKKSVRFREGPEGGRKKEEDEEEEEEEKEEGGRKDEQMEEKNKRRRRVREWGQPKRWAGKVRELARNARRALSWKCIRLMLIDWLFLAILGIGMALTSMLMDNIIEYLQTFQLVLMNVSGATGNPFLDYVCTYLSWLGYTELLVISSAIFVHYMAPQAVGSGIPEMKTILRGVILKDYLTARTLFSKIVGLTFSLGSGIPIGKMGPFVHVAANAANLLSNLAARFEGAYGNECRKSEMLAAACATGVACTFSAPIGGVLFSIEVTTMYFSVRNYWRGFFAAACGATVFRWLRVVAFGTEVTLVAFYQTHFPENAFEAEELLFFALTGLLCGFIGAAFILFYRNAVMFLRQNKFAKRYIHKNWLIYPILVAFLVATLTYPRGYGRFLSGRYKFTRTVLDFFSNCTWSKGLHHPTLSPHGCSSELLGSWTNHEGYGPYNVFLVLILFTITFFFLSALCNTMPIPCGMFMPLFVVGAALGRLMGELVSTAFPDGIPGGTDQPIFPGIYAVVGAAALTGAVTHSVSVIIPLSGSILSLPSHFLLLVAMICCEITGQLIYIIPLMIAVIIANAVCAYLQPSVYDVMIGIKNLPYLPDIPPSNAEVHQCTAENIMVSNVRYLCRLTQLKEIRKLLIEAPKLRSFPIVDDPASMMLLGSISRRTMLELLVAQLGDEQRKKEAEKRIRLAIETIDRHFREAQQDTKSERSDRGMESDQSDEEMEETKEERRRRATSQGANGMEGMGGMRRCALSETAIAQQGQREGDEEWKKNKAKKPEEGKDVQKVRKKQSPSKMIPELNEESDKRAWSRTGDRFLVEPVQAPVAKRGVVYPLTTAPISGARRRRNAVYSTGTTGRTDGGGGDGYTSDNSEKSADPPKKNSCPDLMLAGQPAHWNQMDHQSSLSRNLSEYVRTAKKRLRMVQIRHKESEQKLDYDLMDDERREWEQNQLEQPLEIEEKLIDPAPFQLVRRTSVYKVHYLFSLLDLERAYVTDRGRLVGVVALSDLRIAIQNAQNGIPMQRETTESKLGSEEKERRMTGGDAMERDVEKGNLSNGTVLGQGTETKEEGENKDNEIPKKAGNGEQHQRWLDMIREDIEEDSRQNHRSRSPSSTSPYLSADDQSQKTQTNEGGPATDVVQAVAYLRRKSIAVEDLKPLETTPLPPPTGAGGEATK